MYMFKKANGVIKCVLILQCLFLGGCLGGGSGNVVRYYLVDPVTENAEPIDTSDQLAVEIIDLHLPQYLERFQMVTRTGENRLKFSESNQWGENLRKNLLRTLAVNLATRLSTIDIGTPLNRSATTPDYRVHVHMGQFERNSDGYVVLSGRWQITGPEEQELGMNAVTLEGSSTEEGDYDQIVAELQGLFAQFCDRIASTIQTLEQGS